MEPELGWGWDVHPLNRVIKVLKLEKTNAEEKIDTIKNKIDEVKLALIELHNKKRNKKKINRGQHK